MAETRARNSGFSACPTAQYDQDAVMMMLAVLQRCGTPHKLSHTPDRTVANNILYYCEIRTWHLCSLVTQPSIHSIAHTQPTWVNLSLCRAQSTTNTSTSTTSTGETEAEAETNADLEPSTEAPATTTL